MDRWLAQIIITGIAALHPGCSAPQCSKSFMGLVNMERIDSDADSCRLMRIHAPLGFCWRDRVVEVRISERDGSETTWRVPKEGALVDGLGAGHGTISVAELPGYAPLVTEGIPETVELWEGFRIRGRVLDAAGRGIGRANVSYAHDKIAARRIPANVSIADAHGRFDIEGISPLGLPLRLSVEAPGYARRDIELHEWIWKSHNEEEVQVTMTQQEPLRVEIDPGLDTVRRVWVPNGLELRGAEVSVNRILDVQTPRKIAPDGMVRAVGLVLDVEDQNRRRLSVQRLNPDGLPVFAHPDTNKVVNSIPGRDIKVELRLDGEVWKLREGQRLEAIDRAGGVHSGHSWSNFQGDIAHVALMAEGIRVKDKKRIFTCEEERVTIECESGAWIDLSLDGEGTIEEVYHSGDGLAYAEGGRVTCCVFPGRALTVLVELKGGATRRMEVELDGRGIPRVTAERRLAAGEVAEKESVVIRGQKWELMFVKVWTPHGMDVIEAGTIISRKSHGYTEWNLEAPKRSPMCARVGMRIRKHRGVDIWIERDIVLSGGVEQGCVDLEKYVPAIEASAAFPGAEAAESVYDWRYWDEEEPSMDTFSGPQLFMVSYPSGEQWLARICLKPGQDIAVQRPGR